VDKTESTLNAIHATKAAGSFVSWNSPTIESVEAAAITGHQEAVEIRVAAKAHQVDIFGV
jgi:hypothetical protein